MESILNLEDLNRLAETDAVAEFLRCCGCSTWAAQMASRRPFLSAPDLYKAADALWKSLSPSDWREAFGHHPRIGDVKALREKFASTAQWAAGEQSGVGSASERVLTRLAKGNREYEKRFGYIFIVCATGKSADEMLHLLERRLKNDPEKEIQDAAEEQRKITRLRLEKLIAG